MNAIGIEIGGTKLQAAMVGPEGAVLLRQTGGVDPASGAERICAALATLLADLIAEWKSDPRHASPAAAGVGFGGPVDRARRVVAASFHVSGWHGFPLGAWIEERLGGIPVVIENDTNAAAVAEAVVGAGRGRRSVFYTNSGSGIGGGLVVDGALYRSRGPGEMELGHVRLGPEGGILEDVASGWAIDREARAEVAARPTGAIARLAGGEPATARHVAAAAAAGDEAASRILDAAARHYAVALSHVVQLLNPDVIVLGGGVAMIGAAWRDRVHGFLGGYLMETLRPGPDVRLAALGQDVVPVGAALVALGVGAGARPRQRS
jgi:glucokinase